MSQSQFHNNTLCWLNGEQCLPANATISIFDHGVLYGDGVFEGIRFYNHQPFLLNQHLARLQRSAHHIELDIPFSNEKLTETINTLCLQAEFAAGYIRLVITRGKGGLGMNPKNCHEANTFIIVAELEMMPPEASNAGISTIIAKTQRISSSALDSRTKSLNYLNNILAKQEANAANADEAILLNSQGNVAEASAENLFIVKDDCLITPPCQDGALEGITRGTLLFLADKMGIPTEIRSIPAASLLTADEVFLCGTGARIVPVRCIDEIETANCPGPIFNQLNLSYSHFVDEQTLSK